jgi:PAS domain-containing protein
MILTERDGKTTKARAGHRRLWSARGRQNGRCERQELTAIVDGATDAIIQVDEDCRIVRINPAARQLLGRPGDGGTPHS